MINPQDSILSLAEHDAHACFVFHVRTNDFIYANPAFYSFFNLADKELCIKFIESKIHPDDILTLREQYANLQPNVVTTLEFRLEMPDAEIHPMRASVMVDTTEDENGVITGYVVDLTDYKMGDTGMEQLKNMNKEATNKFTHELAGILASIQTYTLLLSRKTKDFHDEEINQLIESLSQLSKESVHLVRNYKDISKPGDDLVNNPN